MNEILSGLTSLPNLHPAVVHFPIALLPLAIVFDTLLLAFAQQRGWLERAAVFVYIAAAVTAGAAFWAGKQAVYSLPALAPSIELHLNRHSDSGLYTLWLIGVVAIARAALLFRDPEVSRKALRVGALLAAVAAAAMVFRTADLGGALVYRHGVGVVEPVKPEYRASDASSAAPPTEQIEAGEPGNDPVASRHVAAEDGTLEWIPSPSDGSALGSFLQAPPGSAGGGVRWEPAPDETDGLRLVVEGDAVLIAPGVFGDVQVEALLDLSNFSGEAGLVHHVENASRAGFFTVSSNGEYILGRFDGDSIKRLDATTKVVPRGPVRLTVSAIGRHLKGLVGDETVVHGHEAPLPDGSVGFLFTGQGSVRVLSLKVVPVGPEPGTGA